ncbi:conserved hypothetical protein [Thermosinus carboxydivorans Nor1]|uniref:DUF3231 family protein n=1 Tax=Thermosinus carboxydivorans Nor1 TaxID=401526 RepID=A1HSY4_9FIRM|nr:DUF3231 family protein [Thermosinus carboxydivorans]EAX46840.1 conserved hypothetical protein [Thermosinus carboxydivorans Nor1]
MTLMDKVNSVTRATTQVMFDKEPANYLEAGSMYGIIAQGRYNLAVLSVLYNHAQDRELKELIKEAMSDLTKLTIERCEALMQAGGAAVPTFDWAERRLHDHMDIPADARLTDAEIAATIGTLAKGAQMACLLALHQSYQLEIGIMFRERLDAGLDWNYRLLQLMLKRGWLPHLAKITH